MVHSEEPCLQWWTWSTVTNFVYNDGPGLQWWTSSTVMNLIYSDEPCLQWWTLSTVISFVYSGEFFLLCSPNLPTSPASSLPIKIILTLWPHQVLTDLPGLCTFCWGFFPIPTSWEMNKQGLAGSASCLCYYSWFTRYSWYSLEYWCNSLHIGSYFPVSLNILEKHDF